MKLPSILVRSLPKKIWQQIFVFLLFLVVIPLVSLGFLLIKTSQQAIKTSILEHQREIVRHASGEVREHFRAAQESFLVTASILNALQADVFRQETAVVELALRCPYFKRIVSLDINGHEIVTSELGSPLTDRGSEKAFLEAKGDKTYISDAEFIGQTSVITMSAPLRKFHQVTGVLMAEFNLRGVWEIIDHLNSGKNGHTYLVDKKGWVVAQPDKKELFKNKQFEFPDIIYKALNGSVGSVEKGGNLVSFASVDPLPWVLIVVESTQEVFAFSRAMKMQSWVLILLSVIATAFFSLILAKWMSLPIRNLLQGARRIILEEKDCAFRIGRKSEMGRLLFSFNRMAKKFKEARNVERLSIVGKAASAIAHDLKNSLALVDAFVRLLPQRHKDKQFIKDFSETIAPELDSWNAMLRSMMDLSKQMDFSMESIDVNDVVRNAVSLVKFKICQEGMDLDIKIQDNLPLVTGNKDKLKQVILNLLMNSIEASYKGGMITIQTSFSHSDKALKNAFVEIKIMNTGPGITPEHIKNIFQPFYSTKEHGLGLGLFISKEIINYHGGGIDVASESDKETVFSIRIPSLNTPQFISV